MIAEGKLLSIEEAKPLGRFVNLLIVQPTPFCNISCDYCYLPGRSLAKRMPVSVFEHALKQVFASGLVGEELSIVWHAGEPLALPILFYEQAFRVIERLGIPKEKISHSIQTNGMLINDRWCALIKEHGIRIGVSIDGPEFIHDAHRKTRDGLGTHAQVMKGVEALRHHAIDFHAIAVITEESLDHPDEIFNFFLEHEIQRIGFNVEEIEGVNRTSTLASESADQRIRSFFHRLHHLQKSSGGKIKIREFDRAYQAIALSSDEDTEQAYKRNDQVVPFGIISVDAEGNFSTFSPELLGMKSETYGDFCFGNIATHELLNVTQSDKFKRVLADIEAGIRLCSATCEYYALCGGGAPSNKYYENGSFATAETMFCRYTIKTPIDIVLADLEESLDISREH
jgi:uncharacterized protein